MIKEFSILVSGLVFLAGFVFVHYVTHNDSFSEKTLSSVTQITKISSPALSVAFYEPRRFFYEESVNPAYPQMQTINKMDLVYEQ